MSIVGVPNQLHPLVKLDIFRQEGIMLPELKCADRNLQLPFTDCGGQWILKRRSIKASCSYPVDCSLSSWVLAEISNSVNSLST